NAYNLRVMDGATEVVASANPTTGSTWEELSISYTAAETKNYKFRVQKSWGNQGASIDNYSIVCTSCDPQETVYSDDFEAVYVNDNLKGWYLMASPVAHSNFSVDTFTTNNDIATSNSHVAIATYGTSSDNWSYFLAGATRNFLPGKGYSIKKASTTGTVSFTGTLHTEDAGVDIALSSEGNRYNLLGNPYTSYINSATFLANAALSETQTIWVYDQTLGNNGSYVAKPLVEDFILAPGQGFFVKANTAAGGSVNFAETNQSHTSDTFQKTSKTEVTIQLSVNGAIQYAKLYYLNTATTGFDVGYEGEVFGGTTDEFSIYTQLLTDNVGKKYQVQSLPNSEYESMVIPVGVKAAANKEIIISTEALNLPADVNVFLEDKQTNTFTRLDEANSNYKITLTENLDGIGRFYLHTTSNDLSTNDVKKDHISIYKTNNFTLRIVGLSKGIANIKLYNILGKEMMRAAFISQAVKEIYLPKLTAGIYIVQLKTAVGNINKKIILN
ncbi:MAG: T9SS type A sorting domain-containing protein, partial [Polaribacter sp.]|nr:T9SS type A sorting domain-containing protein [Polaribacter sp.]